MAKTRIMTAQDHRDLAISYRRQAVQERKNARGDMLRARTFTLNAEEAMDRPVNEAAPSAHHVETAMWLDSATQAIASAQRWNADAGQHEQAAQRAESTARALRAQQG